MTAKLLTGAHIVCYVNGKLYGRCSNFSWQSSTQHKPVYTVDVGEPSELAPTQTRLSATMSLYRLAGDGGAQGANMIPRYEDIPRGRYFSMVLIDRSTDLVLFQARYCVCQSESWSVPSKGIITGNINIEAIEWSNENSK
jgi:hypothetical protein